MLAAIATTFALAACGGPAEHGAQPPERVDASTFTGKQVRGRLPPEQIKAVVLENIAAFRDCYENARRTNPTLQGKVTVKFEIDPDGIVRRSADVRSDLPDASVVECVVVAYRTLRFPAPSSGVVTVYFPLIFNPVD